MIKHLAAIGFGLLVLAAGLAAAAPAGAVEGESITLTPVSTSVTVDAGSARSGSFTVVNDGTLEYTFIVYAAPYSVANYTYDPDYTTIKDNTDAFQWVQFDQTSWTLGPGERVEVPYTLRVPEGAAPGGHYGVLFAETQPRSDGGTQVLRKKRVGSTLLVKVNGDYTTAGKTADMMIDWLQLTPPLTATARIENSGNVDFSAATKMRVRDALGNVRYQQEIESTVYPGTVRDVRAAWQNAPWFGLYRVELETKVLDTAETTGSYVLIAPVWLLIIMALALASGVYGAVLSRKKR